MKLFKHKATTLLGVVALALSVNTFQRAHAQDDVYLSDSEELLDSSDDPIDIDGTHHRKSEADKMAKVRKQLEEKNEDLMRKKIEDIRMKEEVEMTKRLSKAFSPKVEADEVKQTQAAPVVQTVVAPPAPPVVVAPLPEAPKTPDYQFAGAKLIPNFGMLMIKGDGIDLESKFHGGLMVESMVLPQVSFGVGLDYATMDMDLDNNTYSYLGQYYNSGYYSTYGTARELSYKHFNIDVNSKLFFSVESKIRPYVGMGLALSRSKLQYASNTLYVNSYTGSEFGGEEYASTYLSGMGVVGTEIFLSKKVGFNLEFKYQRGLSNMNKDSTKLVAVSPDQEKLNIVGQNIEDSNFMMINAGLILSF